MLGKAHRAATPLTLAIALASAVLLEGQNIPGNPVAEPRYIDSFYALGVNQELIELERASVTFHSKVRALPGYATVRMTAEFKPGHAPVRLNGGAAQFVVLGRSPVDPSSRYELRLLKRSKDHREFVMTQGHGSLLGATATSNLDQDTIPIRLEEYGTNSYRITPAHPLVPGEYALAFHGAISVVYCFGIDR